MRSVLVGLALLLSGASAIQRQAASDRYGILFKKLKKVSDPVALNDLSTCQGKAINWLAHDDGLQLVPGDTNFIQRYLLALLYHCTDGDKWTRCSSADKNCGSASYLSPVHECQWEGSKCNKKGAISAINLSENNLNGFIPAEMYNLKRLSTLQLQNNLLHDALPLEIWNLNLRTLRLNGNEIEGQIPSDLSHLRKRLKNLNLSDNKFTGNIDGLGILKKLVTLELANNEFIGEIPATIAQNTKMRKAVFHGNKFTGTMPSSFCKRDYNVLSADCSELSCTCCTSCPTFESKTEPVSMEPSVSPSELPTFSPTMSANPTASPAPSEIPSTEPSISSKPTISDEPTISPVPTKTPTASPSAKPTSSPTLSIAPTQVPPYPGYFEYDQSPGAAWGPGNPEQFKWHWKNTGVDAVFNWTKFVNNRWERIDPKLTHEYKTYKGLEPYFIEHYAKLDQNYCGSWERLPGQAHVQSPIDISTINWDCHEIHEIRERPGDFRINDTEVLKEILPSKLRINYPLRTGEEPDPPNADIPHGWQKQMDVNHIDIKFPSEHTINGKRYVGEYQVYIMSTKTQRGVAVVSILMDLHPKDRDNGHFQKAIDAFQKEFDKDKAACEQKIAILERSPSSAPSVTNMPSVTSSPSGSPSVAPSFQPSVTSSSTPTATPSTTPSATPTLSPLVTPSATPTSTPSDAPSVSSSSAPSGSPSETPTLAHSSTPSETVSFSPSGAPSETPTLAQSSTPSETVSFSPSGAPSIAVSSSPSDAPSIAVSSSPSDVPSVTVSSSPSGAPSVAPSGTPSETLSSSPSDAPSETLSPSGSPSVAFSSSPTTSQIPSAAPNDSSDNDNDNDRYLAGNTASSQVPSPAPVDKDPLTSPGQWDPMHPKHIMRSHYFYGYKGSLTEPPCTPFASWRIIDEPMLISKRQLKQLQDILFNHVDEECNPTSVDVNGSVARPIQQSVSARVWHCTCHDFLSDADKRLTGRRKCNADGSIPPPKSS